MKKLIEVKLDDNKSITHDTMGKHTGASVLLKRAPEGTGVIAGGPARSVCELAGISNIRTKSLGSNNKQNVVKVSGRSGETSRKIRRRNTGLRRLPKMANKLKITLVKSTIGAVPKNRKTVEALGLRKIGKTVEMPDNKAVRGMIQNVRHLVKVEEI